MTIGGRPVSAFGCRLAAAAPWTNSVPPSPRVPVVTVAMAPSSLRNWASRWAKGGDRRVRPARALAARTAGASAERAAPRRCIGLAHQFVRAAHRL